MTANQIATVAIEHTAAVAPFVSADIRTKLAIAEVAILIDGMDDSTSAAVRVMRLQDGIAEVRSRLAAQAA